MQSSTTQATPSRVALAVASLALVALVGWLIYGWAINSPARIGIRALSATEPTARDEAARGLVGLAKSPSEFAMVADALIAAQADESADVRVSALNALLANFVQVEKRGPEGPFAGIAKERRADAVATILRALKDSDSTVRGMAVTAAETLIGGAGEPLPAEVIVTLEDPVEYVRTRAVGTLHGYKSGVDKALPVLLKVYEAQTGPTLAAFDQAIGQVKPTANSVPALVATLEGPSRPLRAQAARMLAKVGPDAVPAVPVLIQLLRDELKTKLKPEALKASSREADPAVAAALALGAIAGRSKPGDAGEDLKAVVLPPLMEALSCGEKPRISAAATAIGELGPAASSAIPALRAELAHARWAKSFDGAVPHALAKLTKGTPAQAETITLLGEAWRTAARPREVGLASALKSLGPDAIQAYPALKNWSAPEETLVDAD